MERMRADPSRTPARRSVAEGRPLLGNLGDLEIFARIVTAGSLSAAGREMGLSPPVVSKRIQRLEERLGTRLFQRTTRKVTLTEAGQGFYDKVVAILASIEEAEGQLSRRLTEARGLLRVSAPTSFGRLHIAPHIGPLLAANPELSIDLELSDAFVDIVGDGFDLAIRIADLNDSSLVARRLAPVHRVLCAAPAYLARAGEPRRFADLAGHVLLATHSQDPWRLEGPEGAVTQRVASALRTNSNEVVREAVLAGVGIALRSTWGRGAGIAQRGAEGGAAGFPRLEPGGRVRGLSQPPLPAGQGAGVHRSPRRPLWLGAALGCGPARHAGGHAAAGPRAGGLRRRQPPLGRVGQVPVRPVCGPGAGRITLRNVMRKSGWWVWEAVA